MLVPGAVAVSIAWVAAAVLYFTIHVDYACVITKCTDGSGLKPNELGDFLAGTFAPLAFLWLFVATMLQRQELALQREELAQSRKALENSLAQYAEQTRIMNEDLRLNTYRNKWQEIDEQYDVFTRNIPGFLHRMTISESSGPGMPTKTIFQIGGHSWATRFIKNEKGDELIQNLVRLINREKTNIVSILMSLDEKRLRRVLAAIEEMIQPLNSIADFIQETSYVRMKTRLEHIEFYRLKELLVELRDIAKSPR